MKKGDKNIPLQKLIDLIQPPKAEDLVSDHCSPEPKSSSDGALEPSASLQPDDVIKLFHADGMQVDGEIEAMSDDDECKANIDDSEVQLVHVKCSCPDCRRPMVIKDDMDIEEVKDPQATGGRIPIPNPQAGKQRLDTAHLAPRTRIRVKQPDPAHKPVSRGGGRKRQGKGDLDAAIALPVKIIHRMTKKPEAYILGGGKYVALITKAHTPKYIEHIQELKSLIEKKEIDTIGKARSWLLARRITNMCSCRAPFLSGVGAVLQRPWVLSPQPSIKQVRQ